MANIRIKDLATFSGDPSGSDYLAIDSSGETRKISGNKFALDNKTKLNVTELGSGDDLDALIGNAKSGFYYISTGVENAPENYCALIVVAKGNTTFQFAFKSNAIYYRDYAGNPLVWRKWCKTEKTEYSTGDTIVAQGIFVGKNTVARDGYYGCIPLPKTVPSGATVTITQARSFGAWFSDGQSHSLDYANIDTINIENNILWFRIPSTNVTDNSIAWNRLDIRATVS